MMMNIRPRYRLVMGCMALLAFAVVGHVYYWYWPRSRVTAPRSDTFAGKILMSQGTETLAVWIPYPHQNLGALGALGAEVKGSPEVLRAAGRLLRLPELQLPAFGPFVFPPSTEVCFETSARGDAVRVAAHVYPSIAWLARAAGWLAQNPWLAGGEVKVGDLLVRIDWIEGVWVASTIGAERWMSPLDAAGNEDRLSTDERSESLGSLRLGKRLAFFPSGLYRLERTERRLRIALGEANATGFDRWAEGIGALDRPVIVQSVHSNGRRGQPHVLMLTGGLSESVEDYPATVVVSSGEEPSWKLPGESFLSFLGIDRISLSQGDWKAKAIDRSTAILGLTLIPEVVRLQEEGFGERLLFGAWIDLKTASALGEDLTTATQGLPKVVRGDLDEWLALSRMLGSLRDVESISLQVLTEPDAVDLRFHGG